MVRVTRNEAAARLKVSKSTLDRMIKRGAANNWDVRGDMISFRPWEPQPVKAGL